MSLDHAPALPTLQPVVLRAVPGQDRVLTPDALSFLAELQTRFGRKLHALMIARERRQERINAGQLPDYLEETAHIRKGMWQAGPIPEALNDRRVCITGAVSRAAMIDALNSGARVYIADFDDATAPGFAAIVAGHENLLDHRDGTLDHTDRNSGETRRMGNDTAVLMMRPRGLHMTEANLVVGGHPICAALFDFGLDIFHNGRALAAQGRGPFYELAKLESHREARLWNEIFGFAEDRTGLAPGSIKASVAIESLTAVFEMDEIVWELRDHVVGLSGSRANLIASHVRTLQAHPAYMLPDRAALEPDRAFLASCTARLVKVCHRRGIHAIAESGDDGEAGLRRQLDDWHDGGCVTDPAQVETARAVFETGIDGPHQIRIPRQHFRIDPEMLFRPHPGEVTEAGLRGNIGLSIRCLAGWLSGHAPARIDGKRSGIATAELCRAQLWNWLRHNAPVQMEDGDIRTLTADWLAELIHLEIVELIEWLGPHTFHRGRYASAARIVQDGCTAANPPDFIAEPGYALLNALD